MATTLATQVDASASQQALAGGGGRRGRTAACSSFLFDLRQAPAIHKLSVSGFCRRSKRRVSFCSAMPSWRVNEPSDFREGVLSSIVNTVKKSPYDTDNRHASLLEKEDKKADIVTMVLQERQCEIEPKFKIGDRIYTRVEKEVMQMPFWKKLWLGLNFQKITKPMESSRSMLEQKESEQMWGDDVPASSTAENPVYLSEILREYKGKLYVPEEAFRSHDSEVEDYKSSLLALPRISYEDFVKAMRSNRIELLTCRGVSANSGTHKYREFIVDLKGVDGEEATKWSMHLFKEEAEAIMKEYAGPQVEVETHYTPYVVPPSKSPLPAASSISGRIMLELAAAAGLITTVAYTLCGAASAAALMLASAGVVVVTHVLWPIASPLLWPISTLFATLGKIIWAFAFGSSLERGALVNMAQYVSSGSFNVNLRTFGAIVFVVTLMAFLAKYTLTRRSKDFTKWDLWQAIEFGHSKPQARVEGSTGVGFEDVAGIDDVVHELQQLVNYLKNPDQYDLMGTKPPHGVLLEGPPGCGKTLVAKAIAGEAGVPFFQMAGSEFVEVLVGVGAARIRDLFKRAKVNRPAVVFIDEIDALGAMRHIGGGVGGKKNNGLGEYHAGSQERETTLNQLLIELDGFDTGQGVVFLAATNRMDMLDPALLRPGRFDRKIIVKPPNVKGRFEILKVHAKDVKLSPEVDLWMLAKNLPGWTGADLAQLLQEGALLAVRNGHNSIIQEDLSLAMERITLGIETSGLGYGLPIHQRLATIEVGIAITSHLLRRLENANLEFCNRISIVPRGKTLSCTIFERLEDEAYYFERRPQLFHRLQVLLGGRAAEETMFGRETSNLSLTYLADASWMARKLVSIWNLEGPLTVRGEEVPWGREYDATGPPLDFEGFLYEDHGWSEPSMNPRIDSQVARWSDALLNRFYDVTLSMLRQHKAALTKAIHVVMDKHELCGEDLELILDCYPAGTPIELLKNEKDLGALPKKPSVASLSDGRSGEKISFGTKLVEAIDMNSN